MFRTLCLSHKLHEPGRVIQRRVAACRKEVCQVIDIGFVLGIVPVGGEYVDLGGASFATLNCHCVIDSFSFCPAATMAVRFAGQTTGLT